MFDPNFDPYQELIDCRIEIEQLKINQMKMVNSHNRLQENFYKLHNEVTRLRTWQQGFQIEISELRHKVELLETK